MDVGERKGKAGMIHERMRVITPTGRLALVLYIDPRNVVELRYLDGDLSEVSLPRCMLRPA